jgi:hypothetical protein
MFTSLQQSCGHSIGVDILAYLFCYARGYGAGNFTKRLSFSGAIYAKKVLLCPRLCRGHNLIFCLCPSGIDIAKSGSQLCYARIYFCPYQNGINNANKDKVRGVCKSNRKKVLV